MQTGGVGRLGAVVQAYREVLARIAGAEREAGRPVGSTTLVAVTKTHGEDRITPLLEAGHRCFGENRVQEAKAKWPALRARYPDIELHLVGPLQSNKAADAVALFDVIETVDRDRIAAELARQIARQGRKPRLFVQVNTGEEPQKAGVGPREAVRFVEDCRSRHNLEIDGLMCIPPDGENPGPHFALLRKLAGEAGLGSLSMGMSGDFEIAVQMGATHVRVGSLIFGARPVSA
jgi:pyridoxal phosphate enzyme (YggS family)